RGFLFFFFSSRRRHTRFSRDWSSDVCSSDLDRPGPDAIMRGCRSARVVSGARRDGQVAQLVEQRIENPRVGGSIPPLATRIPKSCTSNTLAGRQSEAEATASQEAVS